jgi:hypothetical protein
MADDEQSRITRLVGDGRNPMSGGGLPLPDAWRAVLEDLLDYGTCSRASVTERLAMTKTLRLKERRIIAVFGSWEAFAADAVAQLASKKLIISSGEDWLPGPALVTGTPLEVISEQEITSVTGKPASPSLVTVLDAVVREDADRTMRAVMSVRKCRAEVDRAQRLSPLADRLFRQLVSALENGGADGRPPPPEGERGTMVTCSECGHAYPKIPFWFDRYWSRDQYYWRPRCKECTHPGTIRRREAVTRAVTRLVKEHGGVPAVNAVQHELGWKSRSAVQSMWDDLATEGLLPPRKKG